VPAPTSPGATPAARWRCWAAAAAAAPPPGPAAVMPACIHTKRSPWCPSAAHPPCRRMLWRPLQTPFGVWQGPGDPAGCSSRPCSPPQLCAAWWRHCTRPGAAALLLLLFKLPEQPNELQLPEQAHHLQQSSRWRGWWEACELSWVPSQKAASIQQQTYLLK